VVSARTEDARGRVTGGIAFAQAHGASEAYAEPLVHGGRSFGRLVIRIQRPTPTLVLSQMLGLGGALFFAAAGVALFLGRWLADRICAPLARLSTTMATIGESGVFSVHLEPGASPEINQLTTSFNRLMSRLDAKDQALRATMAELVEARDHAEAANVAKSQFLANMSHEIRTPLNGVLAMAQIMAMSDMAPAQHDQVEVIRQSGQTLLELLNDILDVSKIEAGKLELEIVDFDPVAVARAAYANFCPVAEKKGLALRLDVAESARGLRRGDGARLRQIINNFLSNALKFTAAGEVALSLAGVGEAGAAGLHLSVRDSGIGIPADKRSLLFKKFSQVDASTTRRYGGTGLGLAICRELAELMGGEVWVESEEGQGATFHLRAPLERVGEASLDHAEPAASTVASATPGAEPSPPSAIDPEPASAGALRVLAAEDNPTNQLVLSTVMQIFGCELMMVGDGEQAVEAWRRDRFDVILMDIQMPRMDGVAAARTIRAAEAAEGRTRTPIVALSANALVHQVEEYRAAGMDGHVAKPIELDKLQAVLETVLIQAEQTAAA
jgi:two-component system, sensor histidine kinase